MLLDTSENTIDEYYQSKIKELEIQIKERQLNFMRLQAQRNDLNDKVIKLKDEIRHLLKGANSVAEVIKVLSKETVLVKGVSYCVSE